MPLGNTLERGAFGIAGRAEFLAGGGDQLFAGPGRGPVLTDPPLAARGLGGAHVPGAGKSPPPVPRAGPGGVRVQWRTVERWGRGRTPYGRGGDERGPLGALGGLLNSED